MHYYLAPLLGHLRGQMHYHPAGRLQAPTSEEISVTYVPATVNYVPTYVPATANNAHNRATGGVRDDPVQLKQLKSLSPRLGSFPPDLTLARRRRSRISQQRRDSEP